MPGVRNGIARSLISALVALLSLVAVDARADTRIALVIGNSAYAHARPLQSPANDAEAMAEMLHALGFDSIELRFDLGEDALEDALSDFGVAARGADTALIYFSGHGMELGGRNYLIPVDAALATPGAERREAVALDEAIEAVQGATRLSVLIVDACRDEGPGRAKSFGAAKGRGKGFEPVSADRPGLVIAFATAPGEVALEGAPGRLSPYTQALTERLAGDPNEDVRITFSSLGARTSELAGAAQTPFSRTGDMSRLAAPVTLGARLEAPARPTPVPADPRAELETFADCPDCPELVVIPEGRFIMGARQSEPGSQDDERPRKKVAVARFALGRTEVTRAQYAAFVRETGRATPDGCWAFLEGEWAVRSGRSWREPGFAQGGDHPVVCVSWRDAQAYVEWLSEKTGAEYRLPSEAEFEYAARGGTQTAHFWGADSAAQCRWANGADRATQEIHPDWPAADCDDGHAHTAPVGAFGANPFTLFDMAGNAVEWVQDCWNPSHEDRPGDATARMSGACDSGVFKGGAWLGAPRFLRSGKRGHSQREVRSYDLGFRVARSLDP